MQYVIDHLVVLYVKFPGSIYTDCSRVENIE
jgi:hypothetical protein